MTLTHDTIWSAIDRLAQTNSFSTSGLARAAGLDPTTFNKSKRVTSAGKYRWPSTESLAKILDVVNMNFDDFAAFASHAFAKGPSIPVIGLAQAGADGYFDDAGFPVGGSWDDIRVPGVEGDNIYALEISGDSMSPVLRNGDKVLVAPNEDVRKGDRVVVKTNEGEVMAKELSRLTQRDVELKSLNPEYKNRIFKRSELQWIARIVWASQ